MYSASRSREQRLEPEPGPAREPAGEHLAAPLVVVVAQLDAIVRVRHLDERRVGRDVLERRAGTRAPAARDRSPTLMSGTISQSSVERGIERRERVGDAAPLLDRRRSADRAVDHVPDEGADDAEALQEASASGFRDGMTIIDCTAVAVKLSFLR